DAGAGEQRRDVDADLRQDDERDEDQDEDEHRRAQQRQQGARAGAARDLDAVAVDGAQIALDRRAEDFPDHQRDHHDGADAEQSAGQVAAEIRGEPGEGVDVPGLQDGEHGEDVDQRRQHHGEDREIAVGTLLQGGEFQLEIGADGEAAAARLPDHVDDEAGDDDDREGQEGAAQHEDEAAFDAQRVDEKDRRDVDDGEDVPGIGQPIAQDAPAAGRRRHARQRRIRRAAAQPFGDGGAVLQDED